MDGMDGMDGVDGVDGMDGMDGMEWNLGAGYSRGLTLGTPSPLWAGAVGWLATLVG